MVGICIHPAFNSQRLQRYYLGQTLATIILNDFPEMFVIQALTIVVFTCTLKNCH